MKKMASSVLVEEEVEEDEEDEEEIPGARRFFISSRSYSYKSQTSNDNKIMVLSYQ